MKKITHSLLVLILFLIPGIKNILKSQVQTLTIVTNEDASLGFHTNFNTANNNFGNAIQLSAYCIPGAQGGVNINRGIFRFNLNSLTSLPNFNNEIILISANVNLYARPNTGFLVGHFGNNNASTLRRVLQNWSENTVTWNNQPTTTAVGAVAVPQNTVQFQDYLGLNINEFVEFWINNPSQNYGLILQLNQEVVNNGLNFYSSDDPLTSKHPSLAISYKRLQITELPQSVCVNFAPINLSSNHPGGSFSGSGVVNGSFNPQIAGVGEHIITYTLVLDNGQLKTTNKTIVVSPVLQISISGPSSVCPGQTVQLAVQSSNSFTWEDGSTNNPRSVANGTFIATASNGSCSNSASKTVMLNQQPTITISASGPTSFCQGGSVSLSVNGPSGFQWNDGGSQNPRTITQSGTYFVSTSANSSSCQAQSNSITVTVNPNPPVPTITPAGSPFTIVQGESITLFSSAANGNNWLPGNQATNSITVTQSGTYSVQVTNQFGCSSTSSSVVVNVVNAEPPVGGCFASNVIDGLTSQGLNKLNLPVEMIRSNPVQALGAPDPVINGVVNFYSLGFGGYLTVEFENPIKNGPGPDVKIHEATWNNSSCSSYPERAEIFASQDGCNFIYLGTICQTDSLELGNNFSWAKFIQIRDVSKKSDFSDVADGYDVAGVECLNGTADDLTPASLISGTLQFVSNYNPGPRKNGSEVLSTRKVTDNAKGLPGGAGINFVSLGFSGSLEARFDYVVFNLAGLDLNVVETSFGNPSCNNYPERARLFGSKNGAEWTYLGSRCQDGLYDLGSLPWLQYIRVVDSSDVSSNRFNSVADGFDLDGVVDLHACLFNARIGNLDNVTTPNDDIELIVFPNPAENILHVTALNLENEDNVMFELLDLSGRVLNKTFSSVKSNSSNSQFDLSGYTNGIYIIKAYSASGTTVVRVIK